jgi:hypothetical protein
MGVVELFCRHRSKSCGVSRSYISKLSIHLLVRATYCQQFMHSVHVAQQRCVLPSDTRYTIKAMQRDPKKTRP